MPKKRYRTRRMQQFLELFKPGKSCKILDVGGSSETWIGTGLNKNVTLLNLTEPKKSDVDLGFTCLKGNGLKMEMIDDHSFDIVFSNSVIEHVGDFTNQKIFADELKRTGNSYWVQTPNRSFPVEPHVMFPIAQFLPPKIERLIAMKWPLSHYRRWNIEKDRLIDLLDSTRLLFEKEMKALFPEANLFREKTLGLTKSLIAYKI
jgi:hypothetical protein